MNAFQVAKAQGSALYLPGAPSTGPRAAFTSPITVYEDAPAPRHTHALHRLLRPVSAQNCVAVSGIWVLSGRDGRVLENRQVQAQGRRLRYPSCCDSPSRVPLRWWWCACDPMNSDPKPLAFQQQLPFGLSDAVTSRTLTVLPLSHLSGSTLCPPATSSVALHKPSVPMSRCCFRAAMQSSAVRQCADLTAFAARFTGRLAEKKGEAPSKPYVLVQLEHLPTKSVVVMAAVHLKAKQNRISEEQRTVSIKQVLQRLSTLDPGLRLCTSTSTFMHQQTAIFQCLGRYLLSSRTLCTRS